MYDSHNCYMKKINCSRHLTPDHSQLPIYDISAQQTRRRTFWHNKLGAGQTRRRSNSAQVKLGIAQYAALHNTWSDVLQVAALFIVTHPFLQLTKTSERVNAAGDQCMAITLMQYFIAIEH